MVANRKEILLLALIIIISGILRFYDANTQLWLDEISAWLNSIQRPFAQIVSEWPGVASHIFFEVLSHLSVTIFGFSPIALRLPAIIFGVLSVYAMYRVARLIGDWQFAIFASALFGASYHHIYYSQNARGYTALICLYLLTTECIMRMTRTLDTSLSLSIAYAILGTLAAYAHPFGGLIVAGQFVFLLGHSMVVRKRYMPSWPLIAPFVAIGIMTALLYAPFFDEIIAYAANNAATYGSDQPAVESSLFAELLDGLLNAFMGWPGLIIALLAMLIGATWWLVTSPASIFLFGLPVGIQLLIFVALGFGLHPRYFVIILPAIYIAVVFAVEALLQLSAASRRGAYRPCIYVLLILISFVPLNDYYKYPMQDYTSALSYVESHQSATDLRFGIHSSGYVLTDFYKHDFPRVDTLDDLKTQERRNSNVWLVVSLESIIADGAPQLIEYIHSNYDRRAKFPGTVGNGTVSVYFRSTSDEP